VTKQRAMEVALSLADGGGIESLSMRRLAAELGVEAASLYHHVRNKDEILDGLVELVSAEIAPPPTGVEWRAAMRERSLATRTVLKRHAWAVSLMASRMTPGPATLGHLDAGIGCLRDAGFPVPLAAHGISLIDSYVHGFVLQEVNLPFEGTEELTDMTQAIMDSFPANDFPHLFEVAIVHVMQPGYDYADEFSYGLDLILDGLHAALESASTEP
jgi:AcrR family transcriptional regulator